MFKSIAFGLLLIVTLSGCAGYAPTDTLVGKTRDEVMSVLGKPTKEMKVAGNTQLHYPRGPAGSHTYFVTIGPDNTVTRWEQVLTEENFARIKAGMSKDDVLSLIGETAIQNSLARNRGYVWSYRYPTIECRSFMIEFTQEDTVRSTEYRQRSGRQCRKVGV